MTHLDLFVSNYNGNVTEELLLAEVLHFVQHLASFAVTVIVYTTGVVTR